MSPTGSTLVMKAQRARATQPTRRRSWRPKLTLRRRANGSTARYPALQHDLAVPLAAITGVRAVIGRAGGRRWLGPFLRRNAAPIGLIVVGLAWLGLRNRERLSDLGRSAGAQLLEPLKLLKYGRGCRRGRAKISSGNPVPRPVPPKTLPKAVPATRHRKRHWTLHRSRCGGDCTCITSLV